MMERKPWARRQFLVAAGAAGLAALGGKELRAAPASPYAKAVLAKKPVAYWRLGEDKGPDALDSTGNGHTGAYKGAPALRQKGAIQGDADTAVRLVKNAPTLRSPATRTSASRPAARD
jgi:hypothetical protein